MTSDDRIREQVTRIWGETLQGDEPPGQTVRPAPVAGPEVPPSLGHTVSISPDLETVPETGAAVEDRDGASAATAGFRVLRTLGRGGMGVVYAARQGSLEREVALKMPLGDPARQAAIDARFVSEALVTGELDHPNIVPVHDLGRDETGRLYMAMKLVRGTPWQRLLRPRADQPEEAARAAGLGLRDHLEVLLKVADAVAFAHSRGIVHRDLKPENVMVGAFGEVLVMDWGLALDVSFEGRATRKAQHRSEARGSAGTPSYMSPELALADYERIGVRSDVYLLGAILYELLTGTPPHAGRNVFDVLAAAARGAIEPPEERAPERAIPRELSRAALRAMAPEPEQRYDTVQELQLALREYLAHEESLRLADEARRHLERLARPGEVPRETRYALYSEALAGFAEALHLWPLNEGARSGRVRSALDLADEALDRGDVGLARAQLPLLEGTELEAARVAALRAAIAARSVSRLRSGLGAAAMIALVVAGAWVVNGAVARLEARRAAEDQEQTLAGQRRDAWTAARESDVVALSEARAALASAVRAGAADADALDSVDWARDVVLWQQGRWSEIAEPLAPFGVEWREPPAGEPERRGPVPQGQAELCAGLLERPELGTTWLATGARELCASGRATTRDLAGVLREAGRRGDAVAALEAARKVLIGVEAARRARRQDRNASPHEADRVRLRVSGLLAPAVEAARERGGAEEAEAYQDLLVPFRLSAPPFGARLDPPRLPPRLVRRGDGSWAAVEPASGEERWRTTPMADPDPGGAAIPVEDGSVVIAAGSQVMRLDGASGRVLGRVVLDGLVCLAWPDLEHRATLELLVCGEEWKGLTHPVRLRQGRLTPPATEATQLQSLFPTRSGAQALRRRLRRQAEDELGDDTGRVAERVLEGLRTAAADDPGNSDLWLAALDEADPAAAALREELARAAAAGDIAAPVDAVRVGTTLERAGFRVLAQQLYEQAAERFLDLHGNPDLATLSFAALGLRNLGAELFAGGDTARALELIELGRRFSTFLEDDQRFYRRYAGWLSAQGREAEAIRMEHRAREAAASGGALLVSGRTIAAVDAAIAVLPLATLLLAALLVRGFLASRSARHADLYARGWRRAGQRWSAFATQSVDRLGFVFLAYLPRAERLTLLLLAGVVLGSAAVVVGGLRAAHASATTPLASTSGHLAGHGAFRSLEEARALGYPAARRLVAEAQRARGDSEAAREAIGAILDTDAADPLALNNLGVVEEEVGREAEARALYARAGQLAGDGAAAARWNQARLDRDGERLAALGAELPHRDRLRADRDGATRPLWASCPGSDLLAIQSASRPLGRASLEAAVEILSVRFGDLLDRSFMTAGVMQ